MFYNRCVYRLRGQPLDIFDSVFELNEPRLCASIEIKIRFKIVSKHITSSICLLTDDTSNAGSS